MNTARRLLTVGAALTLSAVAATGLRAQQVTVGGVSFAQYALQLADSSHNDNGFDVTRAYINVIGKFDHGITTRVTPDIYRDANGSLNFRLKYAWFAWKPENSPVDFRFGQLTTPFIDWQEGLWGYRMQGPVAVDKFGYLTSSDLGAAIDGSWNKEQVNGELSITNGEGYHSGEGDSHKDVAARLSVRLVPTDDGGSRGGLRVTGFAHLGARTGGGARNRFLGELSYKSKLLTLAGDYARRTDGVADPTIADVSGQLFSIFGVLNVPGSNVGFIARVDSVDPNTGVDTDRQTHFIGGISYKLGTNVVLLADYDHMSYQGAAPSASAAAQRSTALFQTQFTF